MNIAVVGTGYVGLVTGACLADLAHVVTCIDIDASKVQRLNAGEIPIYEPGLEEIVKRATADGRLRFTSAYTEGVPKADVIYIAVGTPSNEDGSADLRYVESAAQEIGRTLSEYAVIVDKSTVPVGTSERVAQIVSQETSVPFDVVSNPEFLSEGRAVQDFFQPDRIVIGSSSLKATEILLRVYESLECPKLVMDPKSAELTKYAANTFLAAKISLINEIAHICEEVGADVERVAEGIGADPRIGYKFLKAGIGWGGSCFPKDVLAMKCLGENIGHPLPMIHATLQANTHAHERIVVRLERELGALDGVNVAVLGVAFKANTDDTRESPAIHLTRELVRRSANVRVYDPMAKIHPVHHGLDVPHAQNPYEAAGDAVALVIATEWDEFRSLDLARLKETMKGNVLMDARNMINPEEARRQGFVYLRVGSSDVR